MQIDRRTLADRWPLGPGVAPPAQLLEAWCDPARGYHDARHLTEVLDRLDELAAAGVGFEPVSVGLAAWFHDAVYRGAPDDVSQSAALVERLLPEGTADLAEVHRLVLLTERHDPTPDDDNGSALCDADLAILAAAPDRYAGYVAGVRAEYAHYDDAPFALGRRAVLTALAGGPLFRTGHAQRVWGPAARGNLARELADLDAVIAAASDGATPPP